MPRKKRKARWRKCPGCRKIRDIPLGNTCCSERCARLVMGRHGQPSREEVFDNVLTALRDVFDKLGK